jgi:hypothetical protein
MSGLSKEDGHRKSVVQMGQKVGAWAVRQWMRWERADIGERDVRQVWQRRHDDGGMEDGDASGGVMVIGDGATTAYIGRAVSSEGVGVAGIGKVFLILALCCSTGRSSFSRKANNFSCRFFSSLTRWSKMLQHWFICATR